MTGTCARCKRQRVLQDLKTNHQHIIQVCARCFQLDRDKRSAAATGTAGRPPKSPSQLEDQLWRMLLNSVDSKTLELWLATEGYKGTRGQMLKAWALATIKAARKR